MKLTSGRDESSVSHAKNAKLKLITGASSGLGYALAEFVLQRGDRVALGARSQAAMTALAARYPDKALALALDVANAHQRALRFSTTRAARWLFAPTTLEARKRFSDQRQPPNQQAIVGRMS
jgi:NAD(P)-dependent dehydrogenase (short-subunit alcohol dehydrogenase family)